MNELRATLETRKSKTGNPYDVIVIKLTDTYEKLVFLEKSELELLKVYNSEHQKSSNSDFNPFN